MYCLPGVIPGSLRWPSFIPSHCAFCWLFGLGALPVCWPWLFVLGCLRAIALPFSPGLQQLPPAIVPGVELVGSGLRPNPVTCGPGGNWGRPRRVVKPPSLGDAAVAFGLRRATLAGGSLRRCRRGLVPRQGLGRTREGCPVSCAQRNPWPTTPHGFAWGRGTVTGVRGHAAWAIPAKGVL